MQMITHGLSTGALFILAGLLYQRLHTRDIRQMGGFWSQAPRMGVVALVFVMASLGLPGLGNFIAEFLTLLGSWQADTTLTVLATLGLVAATAYSLRIMQQIFLGPAIQGRQLADLNARELLLTLPLVILLFWLGLFPQAVLDRAAPVLQNQLGTSGPKAGQARMAQSGPVKTTPIITLKGGTYVLE